MLSNKGVLRVREGERDTLRPGERGGSNHLALDEGVIGTLRSMFASSAVAIALPSVMEPGLAKADEGDTWPPRSLLPARVLCYLYLLEQCRPVV